MSKRKQKSKSSASKPSQEIAKAPARTPTAIAEAVTAWNKMIAHIRPLED